MSQAGSPVKNCMTDEKHLEINRKPKTTCRHSLFQKTNPVMPSLHPDNYCHIPYFPVYNNILYMVVDIIRFMVFCLQLFVV